MKINWKLFLISLGVFATVTLVFSGGVLLLSWITSLWGSGAGVAAFFVILALIVSFILSVEMRGN